MVDLNRKTIAIGLVLLVALGVATASLAPQSTTVSNNDGGTVVSASNGPAVTLVGDVDVYNDSGATQGNNGIVWNTSAGEVEFVSAGSTNVIIHKDEMTGAWTNTTGLDVSTNELQINPEDKPAANVSGDATTFNFSGSAAIDDGNADFVYSGTSGTTTATIRGLAADTDVRAIDATTGDALAGATTDASGTVTFSGLANSEHTVKIKSSDGGPGLSNPKPEGEQSNFPTELSVEVSDPDFDDGDNVTVEFYLDGTKVGTNSTTTAQRVSTSISKPSRGSHDVRAVATDVNGNSKELTWTFGVPNELEVREVTDPWSLINDREVTLTFYEGDDIYTRNTTDGNISLENLPVDNDIVGQAEATDYHTSHFIIEDISEQQTVYLLNTTEASVEVRFTLSDRSGQFEGNNATLLIQKPINRTGATKWHTIYGDQKGVEGWTTDLEDGQRYRLLIKNDRNDVRVLGTYTADASETVELTVGSVEAVPEGSDLEYTWNATYQNDTTGTKYVSFEYNDTQNLTDSVSVKIYEQGNESNVLYPNTTYSGPLGSFAISEPVPANQENVSWVVEVVGDRDGEQIQIKEPVGPRQPRLQELPHWLMAIISIGSIWIVAGLFSQLNGDVGALVTAGLGGMWWYVDMLPKETGVGVVVLALITAGIIFVNERRGQP